MACAKKAFGYALYRTIQVLITHQYIQETLCLLHCLLEVAIFCFLRHELQVLFGSLIVVVLLKGSIDSLSALYLVADLMFVVVLACVSENFTTCVSILGDDILREIEAIKASYAAKCNIELSGSEHAST